MGVINPNPKLINLADPTGTKSLMIALTRSAENIKDSADPSVRDSTIEYAFHDDLFPVATRLCEHLARTNGSATVEERNFLYALLDSYVINYVRESSSPPPDKKNLFFAVLCKCSDCRILRRFIDDPGRKVQQLAMSERRRDHLKAQLDRREFITSTIKEGSPHRLQLVKTYARLNSYHEAWVKRVNTARNVMDGLVQRFPQLKETLGEDNYVSFFEHPNLQIVPPSIDPQASNDARSTMPTTTVPQYQTSSSQYIHANIQTTTHKARCTKSVPCLGHDGLLCSYPIRQLSSITKPMKLWINI